MFHFAKMKLFCIWLASVLADQIGFNRLSNNVQNHVNLQTSTTKILITELKLQLVEYMLKNGNIENAKNMLNQVQAEKRSQQSQNRIGKYLKYT